MTSLDELARTVIDTGGELRAGGTDVLARSRSGRAQGPFVDLVPADDAMRGVRHEAGGSVTIGALTTIAELADDAELAASHPVLGLTAAALATPEIRAAATLGGNLLQRNRCWYFRNPHFSCHQTGGGGCPARDGLHPYGVVVDQGPCVAPHPSSLAVALLAAGATADVRGRGTLPVADLYGDGSDPSQDHTLVPGEVLVSVRLPAPRPGARAAYRRAIARGRAEWPLAEAVAVAELDDGAVVSVAVAAGAVARTPLRLTEVEEALTGVRPDEEAIRTAADRVLDRCAPLPQTEYKATLLRDVLVDVLTRATAIR